MVLDRVRPLWLDPGRGWTQSASITGVVWWIYLSYIRWRVAIICAWLFSRYLRYLTSSSCWVFTQFCALNAGASPLSPHSSPFWEIPGDSGRFREIPGDFFLEILANAHEENPKKREPPWRIPWWHLKESHKIPKHFVIFHNIAWTLITFNYFL